MWIHRINRCGLPCSSLQERSWKMLIAFGNDRRVVKPGTETHCDISTSLDSQESSEANTVRDGHHRSGTDGDESGDDPPEEKRSKLKRRRVTHHLSLQHTPAPFRTRELTAGEHTSTCSFRTAHVLANSSVSTGLYRQRLLCVLTFLGPRRFYIHIQ